jgi:hypothetical protein
VSEVFSPIADAAPTWMAAPEVLHPAKYSFQEFMYICWAWRIDRWFPEQTIRRAASRAWPRLGSRMLMSSAMIAMTTSSSIRVKAGRWCRRIGSPILFRGP